MSLSYRKPTWILTDISVKNIKLSSFCQNSVMKPFIKNNQVNIVFLFFLFFVSQQI